MKNYKKILGIISGAAVLISLTIQFFILKDFSSAKNFGYLGYFFTSYFGGSFLLLPFLIKTLNPVYLVVIGSFGMTIDEILAWYAGNASAELDKNKSFHVRIQSFVEKYGLFAVFILGLIPFPNVVYAVSGFAAGHYKIPFFRYFFTNLTAKLLRNMAYALILLKII